MPPAESRQDPDRIPTGFRQDPDRTGALKSRQDPDWTPTENFIGPVAKMRESRIFAKLFAFRIFAPAGLTEWQARSAQSQGAPAEVRGALAWGPL